MDKLGHPTGATDGQCEEKSFNDHACTEPNVGGLETKHQSATEYHIQYVTILLVLPTGTPANRAQFHEGRPKMECWT